MQAKVRKEGRSFGCDVGVNSATEAYTLHGRQRSLTACRFSEFIMNVLLFILLFPSNLSLLLYLTSLLPLLLSPPSSLSPSLSPTHVAYHPVSKNKDLYERRLVAFPNTPAVAVS